MKRKEPLFRKKSFIIVIFFVLFILINWPFISIFDKGHSKKIFYYLFIVWGISIYVLFLMGNSWINYHKDDFKKNANDK
ncbi:MAG: hypothetical protein A2Y03_10320 [Omnitrophica WOR_2 bacterium GWF2_38_59]|nr:MAG: hypothetical protein A2Y03_10320 [Omnitrophica WOR_2 bacterium GWF2_38_59]OGX46778.1 MAG: hypothetical protein A2243_07360 [Omnitrophica WOR_2 bacterium RIFOXYA2_FULL_38_17]OGX59251.1 MAG: hypothetical protein A2447_06145 [Omnitrophica WOR_2 bacterium RIFOXYC2_FULL_38_12]OGX59260.1 MAG: hypothetical protein A2306_03245 [Omnitrophica WOR_2 bacterium RIFOXYB2_FULL_38_16]HBG61162.1 hypothetical protein [Candidatus Omnitrophota bacterium]